MEGIKEECAVCAVYYKNEPRDLREVPDKIYNMLSRQQHRGQLSAGICVYNPHDDKILSLYKDVGKVRQVFKVDSPEENQKLIKHLESIAAIGHVRYATSGNRLDFLKIKDEAQPTYRRHGRRAKRFALAYNGNIANAVEIRKNLIEKEGYSFDSDSDTEGLVHLIALELKKLGKEDPEGRWIKPEISEVFQKAFSQVDGSYSLVSLFGDGNLVVLRDPNGFKPLVWGETDDFFALASESIALEGIGVKNFYDVEPGCLMNFNKQGITKNKILTSARKSYCHFEHVYFAKPASVINGVSVSRARKNLGRVLGELDPLRNEIESNPDQFIVAPVPDGGNHAAKGYADFYESFGNLFEFIFDKTSDIRSFIEASLDLRALATKLKLSVIKDNVKDKRVIVVDDSIVRGLVSGVVSYAIRESGAKEVHLRVTEPPITHPCFYGIDFPTFEELAACKFAGPNLEKDLAQQTGYNSIFMMPLGDKFYDALGFNKNDLCLACNNGDYPTLWGKKLAEVARQKSGCS